MRLGSSAEREGVVDKGQGGDVRGVKEGSKDKMLGKLCCKELSIL
jgi:hypothetical protein